VSEFCGSPSGVCQNGVDRVIDIRQQLKILADGFLIECGNGADDTVCIRNVRQEIYGAVFTSSGWTSWSLPSWNAYFPQSAFLSQFYDFR